MFSTGISCLFIIFGISSDSSECSRHAEYSPITVGSVLIGMGTFFFSYDGHAAFPTIQHDMKEPHKFGRSVFLAYIVVTMIYMPVALLGYLTYGSSIGESIIDSIQTPWLQMAANTLIAIHCILTLVFVLNPLNQEAEEHLNLPHTFGLERVICRSIMMFLVVFVAESVPTFGPLVNLVGGSTITLTAIVFPCLFNVYLKAQEHETEDRIPTLEKIVSSTPKPKLILITLIMVFGVVAGTAATYSAIKDLSTTHFAMPCYILPFVSTPEVTSVSAIRCCGPAFNVSSRGTPDVCFG
uniref:Aa_trans domain-containing protein n=1 Tax=Steinernema glaseri TaxID=37863 RepID=A0A1I8AB28_9BILA